MKDPSRLPPTGELGNAMADDGWLSVTRANGRRSGVAGNAGNGSCDGLLPVPGTSGPEFAIITADSPVEPLLVRLLSSGKSILVGVTTDTGLPRRGEAPEVSRELDPLADPALRPATVAKKANNSESPFEELCVWTGDSPQALGSWLPPIGAELTAAAAGISTSMQWAAQPLLVSVRSRST